MDERRRFPRLDVQLPVTLRHNGRLIPATALNIACGGICLDVDYQEVAGNDNAEIILDLPNAETDVSVRGKIVHASPGSKNKVGIQFTNLYSLGYRAIERYIQKNRS